MAIIFPKKKTAIKWKENGEEGKFRIRGWEAPRQPAKCLLYIDIRYVILKKYNNDDT